MTNEQLIPTLALVTLVLVLLAAIGAFAHFLRKRRNREIASHALGLDEPSDRGRR